MGWHSAATSTWLRCRRRCNSRAICSAVVKTATRSTLTDRLAELREAGQLDFIGPPRSEGGGKLGDRMARFWLSLSTVNDADAEYGAIYVPIDIYIVLPPATYAVILAIRTGSADWNRGDDGVDEVDQQSGSGGYRTARSN